MLALAKSLGKELSGDDISVNAVTPAVAKTKMVLSQDPEFLKMIGSKIPRGRMLEHTEAASMICWLASEENLAHGTSKRSDGMGLIKSVVSARHRSAMASTASRGSSWSTVM